MLCLPVRRPQSDLVVRGVAKAFLSCHRITSGTVLLHDEGGIFASADVRECAASDFDAGEAAVTKAERESAYKDHGFLCRLSAMTPMKVAGNIELPKGRAAYVVKTSVDGKRSAWRDATAMAMRLRALCSELADSHGDIAVRAVAKGVAKTLKPLGDGDPWTGGAALPELASAAEDLPAGDPLHRAAAHLRDLILADEIEKRSLPVLKHPDPKALLALDKPGYLSRIKRDARLGADQLLVNELKLDAYKEPQAWAVVRQEKAEPVDALTDAVSARVSPFEREEYAAEKDFYFIPLTVVARFKAPLDMPQGWRGARTFSPEADLGEVIKAEVDAFDPEKAADYSDADLQKYLDELCAMALEAKGADREKYINYILFLRAELQRRGKEPKIPQAIQGELEALTKTASISVEKQIFGYPAGKSRLADRLIAMMPPHKVYVEPFCGSAAVFFKKEPVETEVLNDIDEELIATFKYLKSATADQIEAFRKRNWTGSEEIFKKLKASEPKELDDKAYKFLYLTKFSYGSMRQSWDDHRKGSVTQVAKEIDEHRGRLKHAILSTDDYVSVIHKYDGRDTLFYLDPPYSGYDVGIGEKKFDNNEFLRVLEELQLL